MKAIFLGSIGVIAETSELQRKAFNAAFADFGLDWYWNIANYCDMLKNPGGISRIQQFSKGLLSDDEIASIHQKKEAYFNQYLSDGIAPRPGISECLAHCKENDIQLGLITTTTKNNIATLAHALKNYLDLSDFDLITTKDDVSKEKPNSENYSYALARFGLSATEVIAIEDTEINQAAALKEDIFCYLYAGEYASTNYNLNLINNIETLFRID